MLRLLLALKRRQSTEIDIAGAVAGTMKRQISAASSA